MLDRMASVMKGRNEYDIEMINLDFSNIVKRKFGLTGPRNDGLRETVRNALKKSPKFDN